MRVYIRGEICVAIAPSQIGGGNTLQICGKILGVDEITTFIIVRNFCTSIRLHLKPLLFEKIQLSRYKKNDSKI